MRYQDKYRVRYWARLHGHRLAAIISGSPWLAVEALLSDTYGRDTSYALYWGPLLALDAANAGVSIIDYARLIVEARGRWQRRN